MKKIFFNVTACICAGLLFAGCNKEGEDDVNSSGGSGFDGVIEATAVTLPPGLTADEVDIDRVKVVVRNRENDVSEEIESGGYNNGRFILNLPLIAQDKYLAYITEMDFIRGGVKVSDVNAKGCGLNIRAYKGEKEVGDLYYGNAFYYNGEFDPFAEYAEMDFLYVDRDVNITGSYSEIDDDFDIITSNLSLKKGWNKMYIKRSGNKANNTISIEITSTELSGLTWYLDYWEN